MFTRTNPLYSSISLSRNIYMNFIFMGLTWRCTQNSYKMSSLVVAVCNCGEDQRRRWMDEWSACVENNGDTTRPTEKNQQQPQKSSCRNYLFWFKLIVYETSKMGWSRWHHANSFTYYFHYHLIKTREDDAFALPASSSHIFLLKIKFIFGNQKWFNFERSAFLRRN